MGANIVFGFIDNAGLFFGGCYLDELFARLPGSDDTNVAAGDLLGTFMGTFFGLILQDSLGISDGPIWANCVGIILGCLIGIFVPKLILRFNIYSSHNAILGNLEIDELRAILDKKTTVFEYKAKQAFESMDADNDKSISTEEIFSFIILLTHKIL